MFDSDLGQMLGHLLLPGRRGLPSAVYGQSELPHEIPVGNLVSFKKFYTHV